MTDKARKLKVGDWVEVRSKGEILETLDCNGQFDGMPFMPEMFAYCGKRFQVYKAAHKTCDTVFPVRGRRVDQAVHLDTRCDGSFHGGCQAKCMMFWKVAWLKAASRPSNTGSLISVEALASNRICKTSASSCTEANVLAGVQAATPNKTSVKYVCQATQLPYATTSLEWWDVSQYIEDYRSGNISLWQIICGAVYFIYYWLSCTGIGLGRPMRWFYDHFYFFWRGYPFPRRTGTIPEGLSTPYETLNLQPGELVRVKSHGEILNTLNRQNRNRGLYFDAEEVPYCGRTYRVLDRVEKIVNERTGEMQHMKTPCVILDSVICEGRYSECRLFCPRSIFSFWREVWLERVGPAPAASDESKVEPCIAARE